MTWPAAYADTPTSRYFPGNPGKTVYYEDIYVGDRFYNTFDVKTAYPFGYGLSYSSFVYSNLEIAKMETNRFKIAIDVENKSSIDGKETILLFIHGKSGSVVRRNLELKGFEKISLKAHEKKTVSFYLEKKHLEVWSANNSYEVERSVVDIWIGGNPYDLIHGSIVSSREL